MTGDKNAKVGVGVLVVKQGVGPGDNVRVLVSQRYVSCPH